MGARQAPLRCVVPTSCAGSPTVALPRSLTCNPLSAPTSAALGPKHPPQRASRPGMAPIRGGAPRSRGRLSAVFTAVAAGALVVLLLNQQGATSTLWSEYKAGKGLAASGCTAPLRFLDYKPSAWEKEWWRSRESLAKKGEGAVCERMEAEEDRIAQWLDGVQKARNLVRARRVWGGRVWREAPSPPCAHPLLALIVCDVGAAPGGAHRHSLFLPESAGCGSDQRFGHNAHP